MLSYVQSVPMGMWRPPAWSQPDRPTTFPPPRVPPVTSGKASGTQDARAHPIAAGRSGNRIRPFVDTHTILGKKAKSVSPWTSSGPSFDFGAGRFGTLGVWDCGLGVMKKLIAPGV